MTDGFDERLRARAEREPFPIPEDYAGRVFRTCAALEETAAPKKGGTAGRVRRWAGWAAVFLALLVAVPNVSPTAAAALGEIPGLGAIVRILTFRTYTYDDGHSFADVEVPQVGGSAAAEDVDRQVQAYTDQLIGQFREECESIGEGYQGLDVSYQVVTDSDEWFTLRIDATRTQASGYDFSRFYHIDKTSGRTVELGDLFRTDADYSAVLTGEVKAQMARRTAEDPDQIYFPDELTGIPAGQNFYFGGEGELVLVFDEYAVAPGSMGIQEFTIPGEALTDLLR